MFQNQGFVKTRDGSIMTLDFFILLVTSKIILRLLLYLIHGSVWHHGFELAVIYL